MARARTITRVAAGLCLAFVVVFAAVFAYYFHTVSLARRDTVALVSAAFQTYGDELSPSDLSPRRLAWLIMVEDPAFFLHHGVDLSTPGAGMTTISQGLVKLLYFPSGFHPGIAKIRQTLIAEYAMDAQVSKEDQLRLALNMAYLGNVDGKSVHGFARASRAYFGKEFGQLSDEQYLTLVAMLVGPNLFKPGSTALAKRMERVREYLAGSRVPASVLDVEYKGVERGSTAQELLMWLLRRLTHASWLEGHGSN